MTKCKNCGLELDKQWGFLHTAEDCTNPEPDKKCPNKDLVKKCSLCEESKEVD